MFQITGDPDWLRTAYYDVLAKTVAPVGWPETFAGQTSNCPGSVVCNRVVWR